MQKFKDLIKKIIGSMKLWRIWSKKNYQKVFPWSKPKENNVIEIKH